MEYVHYLDNEIYITDNKDLNKSVRVLNVTTEGITVGKDGVFGVKETVFADGSLYNDEVFTKNLISTVGNIDSLKSDNIKTNTLELQRMLMESNASTRFVGVTTEGYAVYDKELDSDNPMSENNRKVYLGFLNKYDAYSPSLRLGYNGINNANIVGKTYSLMVHYPPKNNPRKTTGSYSSYGATVGTNIHNSIDFMQGGETHLLSKSPIKFLVNKSGIMDDKGSYGESASITEDGLIAKSLKTQVFSVSGTKQIFYLYGVTSGSDNKVMELGIGANFSGSPSDDTMALKLGKNTIFYDGATLHIKEAGSSYKNVKVKELVADTVSPTRLNAANYHVDGKTLEMAVQDSYGKKQKILTLAMSNEFSNKPSGELQTMVLGSTYFFDGSSLHIKGGSAYKEIWAKAITPKTVSNYSFRNSDIEVVCEDGVTIGIDIEKAIIAKDKEIITLEEENKRLREEQAIQDNNIVINMLATSETFELIMAMMPQQIDNKTGGNFNMVELYVQLILLGEKTLQQVPALIRDKVEAQLILLGIEYK